MGTLVSNHTVCRAEGDYHCVTLIRNIRKENSSFKLFTVNKMKSPKAKHWGEGTLFKGVPFES